MRAAVFERYGAPDVVRIVDVPRPTPARDQVLVRVCATAVTAADSRLRAARFPDGFGPFARLAFGVFRPRRRILGSAFAGVVETVGEAVTEWRPGDAVAGMTGAAMGAHAEYVAVEALRIARVPAGVSSEDAAGVLFGGTTALHFLRDRAAVESGRTVLVNGASGAIGTNAVQLAEHLGATVTAVTSTANLALVRDLGADRVIDYTEVELGRLDDRFDVVLDTVGILSPTSGRRLLTPDGVLCLAAADLWATLCARGRVKAGVAPERAADFAYLLGLVDDGRLRVVHDPTVGIADDIASAHRRVDSGHKVGNIVIRP